MSARARPYSCRDTGSPPVCKPPRIEGRGGRSAPGLGSLETAKEILTEVFGARLGEIEEMIPRWLATFCPVE